MRPEAEIICVGKHANQHTLPQEQINALLVEKAQAGHRVVRLKGGDCYLFGRGGEEALACYEAGVEFEVVPGITSALAVPCYAGIPPTHRDCTSNLAIVTGHRRADSDDQTIEIPQAGTLIFLMSVGNIQVIINSLLQANWPEDTPIAAIEHGTWYDQRVVKGTLADFVTVIEKTPLRTPAIFVVGEVVKLQEQLDWFGKRPNILLLGNHPERYLQRGNVVHRRSIDCRALDDTSDIDAHLDQLANYNWIVFTSVNGARFLFDRLFASGKDIRTLASCKIAAIGQATAGRLREYGLCADLIPKLESSQGLLDCFSELNLSGQRVLLPQANIAHKTLENGLAEQGAKVTPLTVYQTLELQPDPVDLTYIDQIIFTSGSTVRAFVNQHGSTLPDHITCYGIGEPTVAEARKHGIAATVLPKD